MGLFNFLKNFSGEGGIPGEDLKEVTEIITKNTSDSVQKIGIFGSVARGEAREDSDIDVVLIEEGVSEYGEYIPEKTSNGKEVNIVKINPELEGDDANTQALERIKNSAKYLKK